MSDRVLLVFLHGLGCSARTWDLVVARLGDRYDCLALDLPGHGAATGSGELTVEQMADHVLTEIAEHRADRWVLIGHSMGGKIAAIVAARAESGVPGLTAPLAVVLVAASPLVPEPMDDETRADMIGWCDSGPVPESDARTFVDANTAGALPSEVLATAVADVHRVARTAWLAWLERGSLEDWSGSVPPVRSPTLVIAGAQDGPLGIEAQRSLVLPRVDADDVVAIEDAAHLIMLEQPARLAELVEAHVAGATALPDALVRLLGSDRVSARTRGVLLDRLRAPSGRVLDDTQRAVLIALVTRLVPQGDVDLVGRLEQNLAGEQSDGWRFAALPSDVDAWRRGLDTLASVAEGFVRSEPAVQDEWIRRAIDGELGSSEPGHLSSQQLPLWLEDVRAEAIRTWISHPTVMARIGYDGFANGGDGVRKQGYLRVAAGERESWQSA